MGRHSLLLVTIATILFTLPLSANVLAPGDSGAPDIFTIPDNPLVFLKDISGNFDIGNGLLTGTYEEVVLLDDQLGLGCKGCLDFAFVVNLDPNQSGAVFAMNLSRFFGYTTDVGYVQQAEDDAPNSVQRGPFGGSIGFNFNTKETALVPGGSTLPLLIVTNATAFDTNGVLGIGGGSGNVSINTQVHDVLEPAFVPEPSTTLLLSLGLVGFAVLRKKLV